MRHTATWQLLGCLLLLVGTARAGVIPMSVDTLTAEAKRIIVGDVVQVTSAWNDTHDLIHSRVVVKVNDYLQGAGTGTEVLTISGGTVDGVTLYVSVSPIFTVGDHVLLFLQDPGPHLVGAFQGAYLTDGESIARMAPGHGRMMPQTLQPLPEFLGRIERALPAKTKLPEVKPYAGAFKLSAATVGDNWCGYDWTYRDAPISVTYHINANANDSCAGDPETQRTQIRNGMETWNDAGACFELVDGGAMNCGLGYDGVNCASFGYDPPYPSYVVAANFHWIDGTNMLESDIVFNARDYQWWHGSGACCEMDIWNVAAHEFGHTLCLLDLYHWTEADQTMYGVVDYCDTFARTLHAEDIAGIRAIYGDCRGLGACCDGTTCTGNALEDQCAFDWYRDEDCTFFRCPDLSCNTERFESGDFTAFDWTHSGDAQWTVDAFNSYSGAFSAKSGHIGDSQTTSLQVSVNCQSGSMSFYRKVSSEAGYDYLRFYIDGAYRNSWSGTHDWTPVSYFVSAGTHTFKWTYAKDSNIDFGEDAAWIDDVVFPLDCAGECCTKTAESIPYCEGFESDLGLWLDDTSDNIDWTRGIGPTPLVSTGPSSAHGGNYYLYTQALYNSNKTARLNLCFDLTEMRHPELKFWYHMYGMNMGTLSVGVADESCNGWTTVWAESGDHGNVWREAVVDLSDFGGRRIMLTFAGHTGDGPWSDMAIDDICVAEGPPCPPGQVTFVNPQDGLVDACQPHPPNEPGIRQGIDSFLVEAPPGAENIRCWERCETLADGSANAVTGVVDNGNGTFTVQLARSISTGAVTTITYHDDDGVAHTGVFTSHPGNVDGDIASGAVDMLRLIDCFNGDVEPPCSMSSADVDRSGRVGPADVLRMVDLLGGAEEFDPWFGTSRPDCGVCCP